jgi:hypothetical protein
LEANAVRRTSDALGAKNHTMGMGHTEECRDGQSNGLDKHDGKKGLRRGRKKKREKPQEAQPKEQE